MTDSTMNLLSYYENLIDFKKVNQILSLNPKHNLLVDFNFIYFIVGTILYFLYVIQIFLFDLTIPFYFN